MAKGLQFLAIILVAGFLILAGSIFFTVNERQQALVLEFGAPKGGAINEPGDPEAGLHMKVPFIQNVVYFDRRNLEFDLSQPLEIIVANEERLLVDAFVRYQITDPLLYYQSLSSGGASALAMREQFNNRLTNVLSESMRQALGSVQIRDIITTRRTQLMQEIQRDVTEEARKLGVTIIDVRIRQADFPTANAQNVYERMISDYQQQAEFIRADGNRRAQEIRALADKQVVQIQARAEETAQIIRGKADATRNCIFAGAYQGVPVEINETAPEPVLNEDGEVIVTEADDEPLASEQDVELTVTCRFLDPSAQGDAQRAEFFAFSRSLDAYQAALKDQGTTIVLSPDSEFFQYFNARSGGSNR